MNIKYQIFISSTYEDLKEERDQVIKACLEMGHIPVGMEMFSAADEEQWQIIARQIEASDYYVVIVANKYGSVVEGISYTEKEYDYAIANGVPVLGFVLKDGAMWPNDRTESDAKIRRKLDTFKQKVKSKPVGFWANKDELYGKVSNALVKTFNTQPRPGWMSVTEIGGSEVTTELSRLSSENARLRAELNEIKQVDDTSGFSQGEDLLALHFYMGIDLTRQVVINMTWNELFIVSVKNIIEDPKTTSLRHNITYSLLPKAVEAYRQLHPDYNERKTNGLLTDTQFKEIETQFLALGYIQIAHIHSSQDTYAVWKLTPDGERHYARTLAVKRGH